MNNIEILTRAYDFAARRHETQRRKGTRGEPYINHLTEVAMLVAQATNWQDAALVAAGVLHDTIEDTDTKFEDVLAAFGDDIAGLVMEATDDKSLPKAERKRLQIEHAPHKSPRAKILKLADKISNLRSLEASPPDWPLARKHAYIAWAREVAAGLKGQSKWLDDLFESTARNTQEALGT